LIISASRRTDIPAFYSFWFMDKVRKGSVLVRNPFGGGVREVSLKPADVDGIVFWSRNYQPFEESLTELSDAGYGFYLQFTIIGYPKWLDPGSPRPEAAAETAHLLARRYGPTSVVWRYDPVILAGGLDAAWHLSNFARLAAMMEGATDECVISFMDFYAKFSKTLPALMAKENAPLAHPGKGELRSLAEAMAQTAGGKGIKMSACCEPEDIRGSLAAASCVDVRRMETVIKKGLPEIPGRPTRKFCGCAQSADIGAYDTCPAGCAYCYATRSRKAAAARMAAIRPEDAGLWPSLPSVRV